MIQVKLGQLIATKEKLNEFATLSFKGATRRNLIKIIMKVNEEHQIFQEANNALVKQYGTLSEDGSRMDVLPETTQAFEAYNNRLKELLDMVIVIDLDKISYSEIEESNPDFNNVLMASLPWLVEV